MQSGRGVTLSSLTEPVSLNIDPTFFLSGNEVASSTEVKKPTHKDLTGISAHAYLAGDIETGHIYEQYNSSAVLPVASMSKLITALAATTLYSLDKQILITPEETKVPADGSPLVAGEKFTVNELLYPLLLSSSKRRS